MLSKKNFNRIWQIYAAGIVAFAVLGSLAFYFMNDTSASITTNYWTNNDLASQTKTIFASASNNLWLIQYKYLLIGLLVLCLIVPGVYVNQILSSKKNIDLHKLRWIDWMVTSSVMLAIIAVASSLQDLVTICLILGLNVIGYFLYHLEVYELKANKDLAKKIFTLEIVTLALPWLLILVYALGTFIYGDVRSTWYVYVLYLIGALNLAGMIYDHFWQQKRIGKEKLLSTEAYPVIVNQVLKVLFSVALIIGLWK